MPSIAIYKGEDMVRGIELAFIKVHILYHAAREEVFGIGLMEELARHGYDIGPGTLYPTLFKMEELGLLSCEPRTVNQRQRKYYRITPASVPAGRPNGSSSPACFWPCRSSLPTGMISWKRSWNSGFSTGRRSRGWSIAIYERWSRKGLFLLPGTLREPARPGGIIS